MHPKDIKKVQSKRKKLKKALIVVGQPENDKKIFSTLMFHCVGSYGRSNPLAIVHVVQIEMNKKVEGASSDLCESPTILKLTLNFVVVEVAR